MFLISPRSLTATMCISFRFNATFKDISGGRMLQLAPQLHGELAGLSSGDQETIIDGFMRFLRNAAIANPNFRFRIVAENTAQEQLFKERLGRMVNGPLDKKLKLNLNSMKQIDIVLKTDLQRNREAYERASMTVTQDSSFQFDLNKGERAFDASKTKSGKSLQNVPVEHIISAALLKLIGERLDKIIENEDGWVKAETEVAFNQFVLFVQTLAVEASANIRIARAA